MLNMPPLPADIQAQFEALIASGRFQLPPPIFNDMDGEILSIDLDQQSLTATFPVKARYQNPMGNMQGGMITAAIDNTIGPLSMMVAAPNVTKSIEVQFRRPVTPTVEAITVEAKLESSSKRELIFVASVFDDQQKILATARATHVILPRLVLPIDEEPS
jgi:uncharacterized protein (TIGR00369 family)